MEDLKPNGQRAKMAITLIWIMLLMEVISLVSGYFQYELLQTVANGGYVSTIAATANDLREQIIGILYFIAYIVSAITFIQWFRRAYFNLHLKVKYLNHSENWAAVSWFVPIICLYRPYQIMRELYFETKELLNKKGIVFNQSFSISALGVWWTLWIINNIVGQFIFRYTLKAESIDELITSTIAGIIGNIIGIPLALITIKVIKGYSDIEPLLVEIKEESESLITA